MPAGFEFFSTSGKFQAGSAFLGFFCRRSELGNTVTRTIGNTVPSQIVINKAGWGLTYPIFAIRMPGYAAGLVGMFGNDVYFVTNAPVGTAYQLFVFDYSPTVPIVAGPGYGMELFNEAGQCTFKSSYPPLIVPAEIADGGPEYVDGSKTLAGASISFGGHSQPTAVFRCYTGASFVNWVDGTCGDMKYNNNGKVYGAGVRADGAAVRNAQISWDDVQITYGPTGPSASRASVTAAVSWSQGVKVFAVDVSGIPVPQVFF